MSIRPDSGKAVAHRPIVSWVMDRLDLISSESVLLAPPVLGTDLVVARQWWDSTGRQHITLTNLGLPHSVEILTADSTAYSVVLQSAWEAFARREIPLPRALSLSLVETVDY